jgi:hypothetical protein
MATDVLELPLDVAATRPILDHIANKWTVLILSVLCTQPARFNDLKRRLDGITRLRISAARYANLLLPFTTGRSPMVPRSKARSVSMTHQNGATACRRISSNERAGYLRKLPQIMMPFGTAGA